MKKVKFLVIIILLIGTIINAQESATYELKIVNISSLKIKIDVYPIGAVFNGDKKYNLNSIYPVDSINKFIYGGSKILFGNDHTFDLNHDADYANGTSHASISYGKFRVRFSVYNSNNEDYDSVDYCDVDYSDSDYPYQVHNDIILQFNNSDSITFFFGGSSEYNIVIVDRYLKIWDQFGGNIHKTQNKNGFISDISYLYMPINAVDSMAPAHINFGDIFINFSISNDMYTRNSLYDTISDITIKKKAALLINPGKTFNMITPTFGYNNLIVEDSAALTLKNEAKIIVYSPNKIILKSQSKLTMLGHSEITIKIGAEFCNEGGYIRGPGKLIYDEKGIFPVCASVNDFVVEDSTKIVLLDSAVLVLPDNYTLKLSGNESALIMNPNSKIKFGENSKLILEGGAGLIAKNAEFTSVDSTKTWDGIYLSDISIDTISGCKIINASGGLNLTNKSDPEESEFDYHTIIENCEFINKTNAEHYNSIFAYNSDKILIRNNHFYSPSYGVGFSNGIYVEYCPSYHFNILDNEFDNCGMGISAVHSSPYIAGNDLDGTVSGGYGIFLDNSSSTMKYNKVSYFTYNLVALYSSPSLFKNIFENSDSYSLLLDAYSVPLMNPVIGTNITYWYAGDNRINVSPNSSGIYMTNESYPVLDNGYNKFYLGDGEFYMSGNFAVNSIKELSVRNNFWDPSPDDRYFKIDTNKVIFTPYEDGSSGNRSTNTVQLTDIGFGLSDTLYINDQSDNPSISNLIVEAKNYERVKNYADAVDSYKEIVSSYDTLYTAFSLHRILDCIEKAGFFSGNYQQAKNYFMSVHNDTLQNAASRNLSKDLYRKVRFRNSELTPVEEDYTNLYQNNINNSIGFHALLNKTIIANLIPDTTDNFSGAVTIGNVSDHKRKVFGLFKNYTNSDGNATNALTGNNNLSSNYELLQNYPNPFNPTTKITYSIPVSGNISIKIYDLTGKVVKTLVNEFKNAGSYSVDFNGSGFSSGVYFYKIEAGDFRMVKRMVMLK